MMHAVILSNGITIGSWFVNRGIVCIEPTKTFRTFIFVSYVDIPNLKMITIGVTAGLPIVHL